MDIELKVWLYDILNAIREIEIFLYDISGFEGYQLVAWYTLLEARSSYPAIPRSFGLATGN